MEGINEVEGRTIGEVWMRMFSKIMEKSEKSHDEGRDRYALQNVLVRSETQILPDEIIDEYGNSDFKEQLIDLTFDKKEMHDFDVTPSFGPGAPSYAKRLEAGDQINYIIERLTRFPESKKAVIVFPTWDDQRQVLENPEDDYYPCVCTVQYRLLPPQMTGGEPEMTTFFYARSIDAFQKAHGNIASIVKITEEVVEGLDENLGWDIKVGALTGFITDAHVYHECWDEAKSIIENYEQD